MNNEKLKACPACGSSRVSWSKPNPHASHSACNAGACGWSTNAVKLEAVAAESWMK
jgi:hypothetical protein